MTVNGIVPVSALLLSVRWRLAWGAAYYSLNTEENKNPPKGKKGSKSKASADVYAPT